MAESYETLPSGVGICELEAGGGASAEGGKMIEVHYTGWLEDGKQFDTSRDRDQTFHFVVGAGQVIKGWDEGVVGMKAGGKRKLKIPPDLGYGDEGAGDAIPGGATLIFEVELVEVRDP